MKSQDNVYNLILSIVSSLLASGILSIVIYIYDKIDLLSYLYITLGCVFGGILGYLICCCRNNSALSENLYRFYGLKKFDDRTSSATSVYNNFKASRDKSYPIQFLWSDAEGKRGNSIKSMLMTKNGGFLKIIIEDFLGDASEPSNIAIKPIKHTPIKINPKERQISILLRQGTLDIDGNKVPMQKRIYFNLRLVDKYHRHFEYFADGGRLKNFLIEQHRDEEKHEWLNQPIKVKLVPDQNSLESWKLFYI